MKLEREIDQNEWLLIETTPTVALGGLETTREFECLTAAATATTSSLRVAGYLRGLVDGIIGGSMLTGTLSWVVIPLATSATVSLPPIAFFALATSGVIVTYNIITTTGVLKEKALQHQALIENLQAECSGLAGTAGVEEMVYIKNALEQTNAELILKTIQLARQIKAIHGDFDLDLLEDILETIAKTINFSGDETRYSKFLPHVLAYLNRENEKKSEINSFVIERFYQEFSGRSKLRNLSAGVSERGQSGFVSELFHGIKQAAPRLQTAQANTVVMTRNPVVSGPLLLGVGADYVFSEKALAQEQSYDSAKSTLENKVRLINLVGRMRCEKSKLMNSAGPKVAPGSGRISVLGRSTSLPDIHQASRKIGFLSQDNDKGPSDIFLDKSQSNHKNKI